jgi:adenylosuccinate lyase
MISRYTRKEMGRIWSDQNKFQQWLEVELATSEALAERGVVPAEAARLLRAHAAFDVARINEIEREVKHDVIAFTTAVSEKMAAAGHAEASRWLHYGLTSNDVVDTAQALQIRQAYQILLSDLEELRPILKRRSLEFQHTVQIGRTHGVHAEPITFGLKLAIWYEEAGRNIRRLKAAAEDMRVGKISGAVGTFAHIEPEIEEAICAKLGLRPAPVSSQVIQRDRHANFVATLAIMTASLEKIALEVRHLQRTEVREAEEYFSKGQKGSSAMPHKRNPVTCEQICGLARVVRSNAQAAFENVALWHERDISHSSVERVILPDSTILADYLLDKTSKLVDQMVVYPERMRFCSILPPRACCARRHTRWCSATPWKRGRTNRISARPSRQIPRSHACSQTRRSPRVFRSSASCATWTRFSPGCSMIINPEIERYMEGLLPPRDAVLAEMEAAAARRNIPIVGPAVARVLAQLVMMSGAKRIFELGSAIGYSTIWLARAAGPGAEVHYADGSAANAREASGYFERAGVASAIQVHVGDALTSLSETSGEVDFIFNDVDKEGYPAVHWPRCLNA